jgi:hypothetical protein
VIGSDELLGGLTINSADDTSAVIMKLPLQLKPASTANEALADAGRIMIEMTTSHKIDAL